ncbi:hypothetical protein GCM10018790_16770 [Kitasatospora xanthocidica]|uniref:hypothetical protein n=1 Tax=Kitasatospora xanthocidica TaxID=83382 RepID=UPI0016730BBC|nr:hypothetical protein [Kitasatospora xanthocidica]GHF39606.1 hypothetical protein GCM10018790_16770 [Kitasatospora xanthocidica]
MRVPRRLVAPAVAGCLALAGAVAAAPAGSAQHRPLPVPDARYCAAVVGHAPGADGFSPVLGRACSPDSLADALARADGRTRAAEQPADRTLLLEEFKDVDYGGGVIYAFYGDAGGCDATGYHLVNYFDVALSVSSMKGYNNCNAAHLWSTLDVEKTVDLPASALGANFNDAVRELQVFHR